MKKIIYQALTRLWGQGRFSSWDKTSLDYIRSLGADYLWLTGIPRHATGKDFVKGDPGSPYSISDWQDVNAYLADDPAKRMEEFKALVGRVHDAGLKLITDFVPNHVAKDYIGPIPHHKYWDGDWTDTLKVDWDAPETFDIMAGVLRFWASMGVDGFRCDMVELVRADHLARLISMIRAEYPELVFVAEVYNKSNYHTYLDAGFDLLYDKSGMYDTVAAICRRMIPARHITWCWQSIGDMQPRMLNFLENHDELRLASNIFLTSPTRAYAALGLSLLFNNAWFMLYFGQEVGEDAAESENGRTSIFNWSNPVHIGDLNACLHGEKQLSDEESAVLKRYTELLATAKLPAFASGATWDLCYCNEGSIGFDADRHFAFLRYDETESYLVVCNFSDYTADMQICFPHELAPYIPLPQQSGAGVHISVEPWDVTTLRIR